MIDAFLQGLTMVFNPIVFTAMFVGIVISIIVGILPGLGGPAIIILAMPFIVGKDPLMCLAFMTVLQCVNTTGGSLTSILIGVPGENSNAADILDGYPLTLQGHAARAIGAALTSSMWGGTVSVLCAFLMIPIIMPLLMQLRSPELFAVILLGLCFLAVLTQESPVKGLISAGLGVLISCIGYQAKTGIERFTLGIPYLYDGFSVVVMLMGLLSLPVLNELVTAKTSVVEGAQSSIGTYREILEGAAEVAKHWWLWLRSVLIGYFAGVIPGAGNETAVWVAYAHAKQTSKHPETFGTGNIEGVIAPQSAVNARAGGSMLTLITLGIPPSPSSVLILAAFVLLGIQPGPKMLTDHTSLSFALLLIIAVSNIIAAILCLATLPICVKITQVPSVYIFCLVIPFLYIGVYTYNYSFLDMLVMMVITVLGILLRKYHYSIPALILGFIMGKLFEYYLWQSLDFNGPLFFMRPICLALILVAALMLTSRIWSPLVRQWRQQGQARQGGASA